MTLGRRRRTFVAAILLATAAGAARAQTLRGVVVDRGDVPVSGVVLMLVDSANQVAARALTNERGEFRLLAPRGGTYVVRSMRIGFRPITSAPMSLRSGVDTMDHLVLSNVAIALDTVRVAGRAACRIANDSATTVFAALEQARIALMAAQLTAGTRTILATTIAYERTLDPSSRAIRTQRADVRTNYVTQPWRSVPSDSLHRSGYVVDAASGWMSYRAPDFDALLSPTFVEDHCFHLTVGADRTLLGLAFEPTPARKDTPEIRGTLWLDRATSNLRRLEYGYVHVGSDAERIAGGEVQFARMRNGEWVISRWNIQMPVLVSRSSGVRFGHAEPEQVTDVQQIDVSGGELSLARRGTDTLWSRPPLVLRGAAGDSASGAPVAGAVVSVHGTTLRATTGPDGGFAIRNVLLGQYMLEVRTGSLDSAGAVFQSPFPFTDSAAVARLRVPTGAQIIGALCGARGADGRGIVIGTAQLTGDSVPVAGAKVSVEWTDVTLGGTVGAPDVEHKFRWIDAHTDARGRFRFCGVPMNTALTLSAETDSAASAPIEVRIAADNRLARVALTVDPARAPSGVFSGHVLADSTEQPLSGAEVTLLDVALTVLTASDGSFRLADVPAGQHRVLVRRVGYGPLDTSMVFAARQTLDRRIFLNRIVRLDSVVSTATPRRMRDFEENRKVGLGHFLTRDDLAKYGIVRLSAILETVAGAHIAHGNSSYAWLVGRSTLSMGSAFPDISPEDKYRGASPACYAQVYVDNLRVYSAKPGDRVQPPRGVPEPLFDVGNISADQIEAIEYYESPAQTPMKYSDLNSQCGVLVIHMRQSP